MNEVASLGPNEVNKIIFTTNSVCHQLEFRLNPMVTQHFEFNKINKEIQVGTTMGQPQCLVQPPHKVHKYEVLREIILYSTFSNTCEK
jgi:hypothetical protein